MAILGLIPARGGSKGVPRKNIVRCAGRPLFSYTCEAARGSRLLTHVIVSTDSKEVAAAAKKEKIDLPFIRPAALSGDTVPMLPVIAHALTWFESHHEPVEAVVLLQPTSPFRTSRHIDEAISLFKKSRAQTVVSVVQVPHQFTPSSVFKMHQGKLVPVFPKKLQPLRRQDKPVLFARNGPAILVVKPDVIKRGKLYGNPTVGYKMPYWDSIDVDDLEDVRAAEALLLYRRG